MTKPKPKGDLFEGATTVRDGPAVGVDLAKPRAPARAKRKKPKPAREPVNMAALPDPGPRVPAVVPPQPVNLLSLIGQAIVDPAIDAAKLTALVDWYDKREADNAFARDFLAMTKELPAIKKDGKIDQGITRGGRQGVVSRYATAANIHRATSDILQRHGFTLSRFRSIRGDKVVIVLRLEHYDQRFGASFRESVREAVRDDSGGKTAVQSWASGEEYLLRRMTIDILGLRTEDPKDDDRDGNPPKAEAEAKAAAQTISPAQLKELKAAITDCGVAEQAVLDKYGIAKLVQMTVAVFPDAIKACANFKAARSG